MLLDLAWGKGMLSWGCYKRLWRKRATGFGWKETMRRGRRASVVIDYSKHQATNGVGWLLQDQEQEVLWSTALAPPLDWWRKATRTVETCRRQSTCHEGLTSVRGPGVSIMLSRGKDRNSDTFSPDDPHGSVRYAELSAVVYFLL